MDDCGNISSRSCRSGIGCFSHVRSVDVMFFRFVLKTIIAADGQYMEGCSRDKLSKEGHAMDDCRLRFGDKVRFEHGNYR